MTHNPHPLSLRLIRLSLVACLAAVSLGAAAQDDASRLVVWQKNGEKAYFDLATEPETTFGGGVLTIKAGTASVSYQLSNILRYTYENVKVTGIETLPSTYSVKVSERGDEVTFRNLKAGTLVNLYDLSGVLLEQRTSQDLRPVTISVVNRPTGVYIVKSGNETIKLLKR